MGTARVNRKAPLFQTSLPMKKILAVFCFLLGAASFAAPARDLGDVTVKVDASMLSVRVSANTPELNALAVQAFKSHGRYNVTTGTGQYDIKFTQLGGNQVRVDITKGSAQTPVHSQTVSGTSARNALLRAADVAVEKTNGLGLKGFFASKVAFIGERTGKKEVYVGDLFFGEVKQITHDNALALTPRWSPDGRYLLYTSFYKSGFPDIFRIDLGSFQRTSFVSLKGTNSGARYSPNGQQVAMTLSGEGNTEIYVSNAQGKMISRRTRSDAVKSSPCFSPDGTRLVYACEPGPQLYVMSAGGGAPMRVTSGISGYCAEPDWSRGNPNKIAFTMREGRNFQIGVLDLATRTGGRVSKASFDAVEPSWLADGRHLIYSARNARESRICILDTETGRSTAVSPASLGTALQASVYGP